MQDKGQMLPDKARSLFELTKKDKGREQQKKNKKRT